MPIDLHPFERIEAIHGRNLLEGDQIPSGHLVTNLVKTDDSFRIATFDGVYKYVVMDTGLIEIIRPNAEPVGRCDRVRDVQPIALPASTSDAKAPRKNGVVCSCGYPVTNKQGLSSHQRRTGHTGEL